MSEKVFFSIPVYRLTEERYHEERDSYVDKFMFPGPAEHNEEKRIFYKKYPRNKINIEEHLCTKYGGAWIYNEIIGWIELHFLGNQIRGEFWCVKAKRIVRSRKKVFIYDTWKLVPEIEVAEDADNIEIFFAINEYLSDCKKELKGRYIDTSKLDTIGKYVDWRSLIIE